MYINSPAAPLPYRPLSAGPILHHHHNSSRQLSGSHGQLSDRSGTKGQHYIDSSHKDVQVIWRLKYSFKDFFFLFLLNKICVVYVGGVYMES